MLLICLSLIGLIAVGILAEKGFKSVESVELIPVPVRVDEAEILRKKFGKLSG